MAEQTWFHWALLSAVFAAATAVLAKVGLEGIDPDFATLIRTAVILLFLGALVAGTGKFSSPAQIPAKSWVFLVLSGLATGASWLCYFRALQLGQVSQVAPIDKLSLALVVIFAFIFLGERPSLREWGGIALVVSGVLLIGLKR